MSASTVFNESTVYDYDSVPAAYADRLVHSGENSWLVADSPISGEVATSALQFFDEGNVRAAVWYHATNRENWFAEVTAQDGTLKPLVHLGTKEAAEDRMRQRSRRVGGQWRLYAVSLDPNAAMHPHVNIDENGHAPYFVGDEQVADGYDSITRYVNECESEGSISLLVNPAVMTLVSVAEMD